MSTKVSGSIETTGLVGGNLPSAICFRICSESTSSLSEFSMSTSPGRSLKNSTRSRLAGLVNASVRLCFHGMVSASGRKPMTLPSLFEPTSR